MEGHYDRLRLRHGDNIREFRDVEVGRPWARVWHEDPDIDGSVYYVKEQILDREDRWELVGTEIYPDGREASVRVGFFTEHVVED